MKNVLEVLAGMRRRTVLAIAVLVTSMLMIVGGVAYAAFDEKLNSAQDNLIKADALLQAADNVGSEKNQEEFARQILQARRLIERTIAEIEDAKAVPND